MSVRFGHWLGFCRTPPPRRRRCICSDHPRTHRAPGRRARHRVLVGRGRCRRPGVSQNGRPARASSSLIWWFSSAMMPTVARLVAVNAAVTVAAVASCSVPRAARISRAGAAILRCRATAFERGLDRGQAQPGALLGAGARSSTPRASPWARSSKATGTTI